MRKATGPVFSRSLRLVSSPAMNIRRMTPISAISTRKSFWLTMPRTLGPMMRPATISPTTWGAWTFRARIPNSLAATTMIAMSKNR